MPKIVNFKKDTEFHLKVKETSKTHAVMEIYGPIGSSMWEDGVTAKDVVDSIKNLGEGIKTLELHINSPGGSVTEGIAIYNRLLALGKKVEITVVVDALAGSIASIIALAGKKVVMGEAGFFMVHKPWTFAMGNDTELEDTIRLLQDIEAQMITIYAKKTGLSRAEIASLIQKDNWMDSETAKDYGFIDEVQQDTIAIAASVVNKAHWLGAKVPQNLKTDAVLARAKANVLSTKIKDFLARK